jgi:hypothetical protein
MATWRALERELMEPRLRESMGMPVGPLPLDEQLALEMHVGFYLEFMKRTTYGDMLGPMAPALMKTLHDEVKEMRPREVVIEGELFDVDLTVLDGTFTRLMEQHGTPGEVHWECIWGGTPSENGFLDPAELPAFCDVTGIDRGHVPDGAVKIDDVESSAGRPEDETKT